MMRCAIYARFSTDKQDVQSIETQLMMCRREVVREGWQEVACFTEAAESTATIHRPGMKALLAAVAAGGIDIVYADAMDRLSRSQADIAMLFERLRFRGIILATRKEGVVAPLHIGMMGTINAEHGKQTYRKNPDTGKRHAFINPENMRADVIEAPELRIVPVELWERVKARQATLTRAPTSQATAPALPFFAQQRPRYLLTGKMTCGTCGASDV